MNHEEIYNKLFSLHRFGIKPGLERTIELLEFCGNPHQQIKTVHIAGTKGKGTVCSILASILQESGYKTGLYTSPHILNFNERIRINGMKISDDEIVEIISNLLPVAEKIGSTFFEITTVAAFQYFAENKIDIGVIETGMGGRFDSTNVLNPLLSIITTIGLDHQEYLGESLEEIAYEKAGIIKSGSLTLIGDKNPSLRKIFISKAEEVGSLIEFCGELCKIKYIEFKNDYSTKIEIESSNGVNNSFDFNFGGSRAADNILIAVSAAKELKKYFRIDENSIRNGIKKVRYNTGFRGRFEFIREEAPLLIDAAHNPDSIQFLFDTLVDFNLNDLEWTILFAVMNDKEVRTMLEILRRVSDSIILTKPKIERAFGVDELADIAKESGFSKIKSIEDTFEASIYAVKSGEPLIVTGSFYLLGEFANTLNELGSKFEL